MKIDSPLGAGCGRGSLGHAEDTDRHGQELLLQTDGSAAVSGIGVQWVMAALNAAREWVQ
jgi:hypothetical protein